MRNIFEYKLVQWLFIAWVLFIVYAYFYDQIQINVFGRNCLKWEDRKYNYKGYEGVARECRQWE
jgi:hypothetical protein